jgi:hypothetical protein
MPALETYWKQSYITKGTIIENIGKQFLKYNNFTTTAINTKLLQKTQGDTVGNLYIPRLLNKQITADYKAGGCSKGYNDLCIDIQYFKKDGTPLLVAGTNIGWLFTTVSDFIITVVPKTKKLYFITWYNGLHKELIKAYSLLADGVEQMPVWSNIDLITLDNYKNTEVIRVNLEKLLQEHPELITEYKLISMDEYCNILDEILD